MEKKTEPDSELILAVKQSDSCDSSQVNNSHGNSNGTGREASDGSVAVSSYGRENNEDAGEEWSPETEDLAVVPSASADRSAEGSLIKAELGKEGEEEEMNEEEYEEEEDDEQLLSEESELEEEAESGGEQTDYENNDIVRYQAAVDVSNFCLVSTPFFVRKSNVFSNCPNRKYHGGKVR
jgi:hypothetical protein